MKRISVLLLAFGMLTGLFACGGGGGSGGSGPYSMVGMWQIISTDTYMTELVGTRFTFNSDGKGRMYVYGIGAPITWVQNGNSLGVYAKGADPLAVSLTWSGPDRVRWTNPVGGSFDLVKIGVASVVMTPAVPTGQHGSVQGAMRALRKSR